jgi:DNA-directed RNA polymerase specialized sigma24 family protein
VSDLDSHLPAIVAGDAVAFGRWVAGSELRLRASLASFAARVDVEAVLQESLLRVWQVAPRFVPDGAPDALLRFAVRVARNAAVSELRRLGAAPLPEDEAPVAVAQPELPDPLLREVIRGCREKLPKKPAACLTARLEQGGLERDEVLAERLDMAPNAFLQNITRARKLLAECLERHGVPLAEVLP